MPTASTAAAIMAISDTIWEFERWKERTKNVITPLNDAATPAMVGLSDRELAAVRALAKRLFTKDGYSARVAAYGKKVSNDTAGKAAWGKWINQRFQGWKIRKDIEALLDRNKRHPRQLLHKSGSVSGHTVDLRRLIN